MSYSEIVKYECPKCKKFSKFSKEETPSHGKFHACYNCGHILFPNEFDGLKTKPTDYSKDLTEDAAGTTTGDIAVNPGAGGGKITKRKLVAPDGQYNGHDYFEIDADEFTRASMAQSLGQRYNFSSAKVINYLRDSNYSKPFMLKHKDHYIKVDRKMRY